MRNVVALFTLAFLLLPVLSHSQDSAIALFEASLVAFDSLIDQWSRGEVVIKVV